VRAKRNPLERVGFFIDLLNGLFYKNIYFLLGSRSGTVSMKGVAEGKSFVEHPVPIGAGHADGSTNAFLRIAAVLC
jgi:hypothetical protein